jgi:DNA-binding response OmpR family regulator
LTFRYQHGINQYEQNLTRQKGLDGKLEGERMRSILIVEDEQHLLDLYTDEFNDAGFQVHSLSTGKEAIELIKKERPSVVVLDIKLSDMEGLRVLEEIKEFDRSIPVILNSAYAVYKSDFSSWMADDYVVKSSDISELVAKVKQYAEPSARNQSTQTTV